MNLCSNNEGPHCIFKPINWGPTLFHGLYQGLISYSCLYQESILYSSTVQNERSYLFRTKVHINNFQNFIHYNINFYFSYLLIITALLKQIMIINVDIRIMLKKINCINADIHETGNQARLNYIKYSSSTS